MAKSNKSKWVIGLTGAALSAFVITQVSGTGSQNQEAVPKKNSTASMSKQEKELVQLDWSNYSINGAAVTTQVTTGGTVKSDRQTRRS